MAKLLAVFILLAVILGSGTFWYVNALLRPVNPNDTEVKLFVIQKGEKFNKTAERLTSEGYLKSPLALRIANYMRTDKKPVQAGAFRLSKAMSPEKILQELSSGKIDMWVTILEGWRREEVAEAIKAAFTESSASFEKEKFLAVTKNKEGYLFPDTYLVPLNTSEEAIASLLETTMQKRITPEMKDAMAKSGRTLLQTLTMASIIEREARTSESRKKVSGILWRRVDSGWPLQADATLQFAKGYDAVQKTWWKPPLAADKELVSAYNTYKHIGLPPGPICAPSLDSIKAAVYPEKSSYWYYLTDTQGRMHYAETLDQHNQNVQTYLR